MVVSTHLNQAPVNFAVTKDAGGEVALSGCNPIPLQFVNAVLELHWSAWLAFR